MKPLALLVALAACSKPAPATVATSSSVAAQLTEIAEDAQPILDRWAAAVGGRDAIRALGGWHARGRYTRGGVTGTIEVWQHPSYGRHEIIELGILREERIYSGADAEYARGYPRGWLVDRNREVRRLAGFEIDDQLANTFFGVWAPLVTDRRRGGVIADGDKLVLTPAGGKRPDTVAFDPATHLPATLVRRDGEKLRTTRLADWRAVDGVRVPFKITEDNGNPNDAVAIEWQTFERSTRAAFARPANRPSDATIAASPITVPIEVVYGGLIFMQVRINDVPMSFVFDTGAEATVLNSSRLSKLGLTGFGTFATGAGGGDVELTYAKGVTTKVGDAKTGEAVVRDQIVAAVLLDALEAPLRRPLDGILGYDFISRFVIEIDYMNQTMRLYDRASYQRPKDGGTAQHMTLQDSTPFISADVHLTNRRHVTGLFVLDTGCLCDVQMSTPFVDRNRLLEQLPDAKQDGYSAGAGGETKTLSATIPALTIGDRTIAKPKADLSRDEHGAGADPESAGLIGSVALGRFVLVLDYQRERFYLDPPIVVEKAAGSPATGPTRSRSSGTER